MTARRALPADPSLLGAGPRRALHPRARVPRARTIVVSTATLASVAVGCALFLPAGGGAQPIAIASQQSASEAAHLAALSSLTASPRQSSEQRATSQDSPAATPTSVATPSPDASPSPTPTTESPTPAPASSTTATTTKAATPAAKATAAMTKAAASSAAEQVVAYAREHIGYPYEVGTMGPDYYDCAGLVAAAYRSAGYNMPFSEAKESSGGTYVALEDLQPGHVVVWGSPVHSVSIYAGDGVIIIADGPDYGIRTVTLDARLKWDTFAGGRRYLG